MATGSRVCVDPEIRGQEEMNISKKNSCRICGSAMRMWDASWLGFEWGRCTKCRSVQKLIDESTYLTLGASYDPGYIEAEKIALNELEIRMGVFEKEVFLRRLLGSELEGSLLDIGCGMGGFLLAAKRIGFEALGVEPSVAHSKAAVERFGLDVVNGFFKSGDFDRKFDVVVLSHVIEHIYDPCEFIQDVLRVMRVNGKLIIVTPNCDSISARVCMKFWSMYKPIDHVTLFTKRSMAEIVPSGSSLQILRTSEWPGEFAAHILSSLKTMFRPTITSVRPGKPGGPRRQSNLAFATRFVLALLSLPFYWIGFILDKRSCLYAVIAKSENTIQARQS